MSEISVSERLKNLAKTFISDSERAQGNQGFFSYHSKELQAFSVLCTLAESAIFARESALAAKDKEIEGLIKSVTQWQYSRPRKPAVLAFSAGLERQIADLIEAENNINGGHP